MMKSPRANQKAAFLLWVDHGAALDDPLEHVPVAPHDGEHTIVAGLQRLAAVQTKSIRHALDVPLDVLLAVVLGHVVGVRLDRPPVAAGAMVSPRMPWLSSVSWIVMNRSTILNM